MTKDVGIKINYERKIVNNMTLQELANKIDISVSFLSDIERGRSNPSLEKLTEISKALNKPISYFLNEEDINDYVDPEVRAIARDISDLEDNDRNLLKSLIQSMSKKANDKLKK